MSSQLFLQRIVAFNPAVFVFTILPGLWKTGNPSRYFGEGRSTTFLSAAQLLTIGGLAWQIFTARKPCFQPYPLTIKCPRITREVAENFQTI